MRFHTIIRDCLQLNWALPCEALSEAPPPLRWEVVGRGERQVVFVSALLFRHEGLRLRGVPGLRLSYPQFHLRLNVIDGEGLPAVLVQSVLVPSWVLPAVRVLARQHALPGLFQYPDPLSRSSDSTLVWSVRRRHSLEVSIEPGVATAAVEPDLGSWNETVRHLRRRTRGYVVTPQGLRRDEMGFSEAEVVPVKGVVHRHGLLADMLPSVGERWPSLHSSWICPEIPYVVEWGELPEATLRRGAPVPG